MVPLLAVLAALALTQAEVLTNKCVRCHSGAKPKGGYAIDPKAPTAKALEQIRSDDMPPDEPLTPEEKKAALGEDKPTWGQQVGKMHLLIIHFPVVLSLIAACRRLVGWSSQGWSELTCASAWLAAGLGVLYGMDMPGIEAHMGAGLIAATVATLAAVWQRTWLVLATAALIGVAAHLGGVHVHGPLF